MAEGVSLPGPAAGCAPGCPGCLRRPDIQDCRRNSGELRPGDDGDRQRCRRRRQNLSLALEIQDVLTQTWPSLARPVVLRTSRFNQHLSTGTLLVEIGTHGNTLQEAITAARLYAEAAAAVLNGTQPSSSAPAP